MLNNPHLRMNILTSEWVFVLPWFQAPLAGTSRDTLTEESTCL